MGVRPRSLPVATAFAVVTAFAPKGEPVPDPAAKPSSPRRRVLVVEDSADAAESLRVLLELVGHDVRVASTGPDGVREAEKWRPEVVFCDIGLPGFDGWEVARRLRADPGTAGARLYALTAYNSSDDRRRSREAGFEHHIAKPADFEELLGLLDS
jgi:CheY-like chemotaxis protein